MGNTLADLKLAFRGLRRNPLFATVAILSLALGIGANTAIFTLLDQIVLRKLPVKDPRPAGDALPGRGEHGQQRRHRACTPIRSTRTCRQRAEPFPK